MGTAWSLLQVNSRCNRDILAIHGDLSFSLDAMKLFVSEAINEIGFSSVAVHQRSIKSARSEIRFDPTSRIVLETREKSLVAEDMSALQSDELVWSNSGIYYFRTEHLKEINIEQRRFFDVPKSILLDLELKNLLKAQIFKGARISFERPEQLKP